MIPDILTKSMPWTRMKELLELAGYVCSGSTPGESKHMQQVLKLLALTVLASQVTAAEATLEMELRLLEEEKPPFPFSWEVLLLCVVVVVVSVWEMAKWGVRRFCACLTGVRLSFRKLSQRTDGNQNDHVGGLFRVKFHP